MCFPLPLRRVLPPPFAAAKGGTSSLVPGVIDSAKVDEFDRACESIVNNFGKSRPFPRRAVPPSLHSPSPPSLPLPLTSISLASISLASLSLPSPSHLPPLALPLLSISTDFSTDRPLPFLDHRLHVLDISTAFPSIAFP